VLGLAVAQLLYEAHPDWREGDLPRARLQLVSEAALAREARSLSLGRHLRLGRTERRTGGDDKDSILADTFEALLGALYLDGGIGPVLAFVRTRFAEALTRGAPVPRRDAKTTLQEWAQKQHRTLPRYETLTDSGVDADSERFVVEVRVSDVIAARGVARTKRVAEARAAELALRAAGAEGGAAPPVAPEGEPGV
jgi:ribonuclease-3